MYGYEVILMSPERDRQVGLRFISARRYSSVIQLLRSEGEYREYRKWTMVSFRCAHAETPASPPREIHRDLAPPGALLQTVV